MKTYTRTYLGMTSPQQLRPKRSTDPHFQIREATVRQWQLNRFLYAFVGEAWAWRDKLGWSDAQWRDYVETDALKTFVANYDGSIAGYFELSVQTDEVEIIYFGLAPSFIGKGLGGPLLTHALEQAWQLHPRRVWVHTCTLDHPSALSNYQSRGMVVVKTETKASI